MRPAGRPRSAGATRTRSYFDSREGKSGNDESDEVPTPFLDSNDEAVPPRLQSDDDEAEPSFPLLGNFDVNGDASLWEITRTVKPQEQFVNDLQFSLNFTGISNLHKLLTGNFDISGQSGILCQSGQLSLLKRDDDSSKNKRLSRNAQPFKARGPIGFLFALCDHIYAYLMTCFGACKNDGGDASSPSKESGLSVSSPNYTPVPKPSNLLRVEERIRRELSLAPQLSLVPEESNKQMYKTETNNDSGALESSTPEEKPMAAKIDESFWMDSGQQLVGPKKRGGVVQQDVELTIKVEQIKFTQHPKFTAEDKALSHVTDLYKQYREHLDEKTFHCFVTRLAKIFQRIRHASLKEESKADEVTSESMMIALLNDLKSTSSNLVGESDCIKNISSQIKQGWDELLLARKTGSACTNVELKTVNLPSSELNDDIICLLEEMNSAKRVLRQFCRSGSYASTLASLQFLDDVESSISNLNHLSNIFELIHPDSSQPGWIPKEKYFVRLIVNGTVVGDTKVGHLAWPSFSVKLDHRFNCKMFQKPTDTSVQIWKSSFGFVPDTLICTCFNNIPVDGPAVCNLRSDELDQVSPRPAVGNLLQFSSTGPDLQYRWKGTLRLSSSCKAQAVKRLSPATCKAEITRPQFPTIHQSKRLIGQSVEVKKSNQFCRDRQSMMAFKLPSNGILFSKKSLLEEPLRHALIRKRNSNSLSVPSPIPITELMVQNSDVYHDLMNPVDESTDLDVIKGGAMKERALVKKKNIMDICSGIKEYSRLKETRKRKHHFSEVIQDVGLFRFADDPEFDLLFPPPKRSLFPQNLRRLPVMNQNQPRSLLLTIVCGKNVPMKLEADALVNDMFPQLDVSNNNDDNNLRLSTTGMDFPPVVNEEAEARYFGVFAKIQFREMSFRTKVVNGRSLSLQWKETVCIPLDSTLPECPLTSTTSYQDEVIEIFLFDCTSVDLKHMGGFYEDEDSKISEVQFLGHASIPLVTILREGSMNGFIHCQSPDIVVGYAKEPRSCIPHGENEENGHILSIMEKERRQCSNTTMLRIHATTEPLTVIPPVVRPDFPSRESKHILTRVEQWSQHHLNFHGSDPVDHFSILWPDSRGNSFLVSRFTTEQAPPHGFDTLASCSHYVSRIPLLDRVNLEVLEDKEENMILTSQQFINIMAGSREEHAILLTNFFLYLSKKYPSDFDADLFLAVGFAIPEGETAWVIRRCRKTKEVVFWDAATGCAYQQTDESCPLQKIYYLASPGNIYSNIERVKKPNLLGFDLDNPRKWAPLHVDGNSNALIMTIQNEVLHFTPPDTLYAREIQGELSDSIQIAIRGWRRGTTIFRSDVTTKLASTIEKLEQAKMTGQLTKANEANFPVSITKTRTVHGFTIHYPFTSVQDVLNRIKATEIYHNRNPRVEFAVAVRAFAYPGGVLSLWVFVCLLVPK